VSPDLKLVEQNSLAQSEFSTFGTTKHISSASTIDIPSHTDDKFFPLTPTAAVESAVNTSVYPINIQFNASTLPILYVCRFTGISLFESSL